MAQHAHLGAQHSVPSLAVPNDKIKGSPTRVASFRTRISFPVGKKAVSLPSTRREQCSFAVRADVNAVAEPAAAAQPAPSPTPLLSLETIPAPAVPASPPAPQAVAATSNIIEAEFLDTALLSSETGEAEAPQESAPDATSAESTEESTNGAVTAAVPAGDAAAAPETAAEEGLYEPMYELVSAAKMVPHPEKVEKGGEDAYLISDVGAGVLCVADGVGGWANDGVDPALYSKELVYHLQQAVEGAECQEDLEPVELIRTAHTATGAEGAATAVVAVFDGERSALDVANVGDSGVMVVRKGEVIFRSDSQQHFFDCPFQLGSESSDSPDDAELYSVELAEGDTVVMGSDGLFDNVFDKDIACVVKVFGGQDETAVQRAATALAALASKHAADPEYMSPYILDALENGKDLPVWEKMLGRKLSGGKLDDITVLVAQVVKSEQGAKA